MKNVIFYEIMRELKAKPKLMKKLKIFLIVGVVGVVLTGVLAVWAGITAINYVASTAGQVIQSPIAKDQVETLKAEVEGIAKFQALSCWTKAQSLLAVQPWLEKPVQENLHSLKLACFEEKSGTCQGTICEPT
jgi:hypothetical protein